MKIDTSRVAALLLLVTLAIGVSFIGCRSSGEAGTSLPVTAPLLPSTVTSNTQDRVHPAENNQERKTSRGKSFLGRIKQNNPPTTIQMTTIIVSLISLLVAWRAYRISTRTSSLNTNENITRAFDAMCQMAMSSEIQLEIMDSVFFPEFKSQPIERKKVRWGTYLVLNTIERTYFAYKHGAINKETALPILESMLDRLLSSEAAQEAFRSGSYDKHFITYVCERTGVNHPQRIHEAKLK